MNLVIGNTSQQSYYYPEEYIRISSRRIDINKFRSKKFDSVFISFAEQRIYEENIDYIGVNFNLTLNTIKDFLDISERIFIFTSCEMWANCIGKIDINTPPNFDLKNKYAISKFILFDEIIRLRKTDKRFEKVILIHPFYFNSVYRSKYFLFGKVFDSIINKKKIEVGNLNFYRDMIHTKFMVSKLVSLNKDSMMGAGKLFNVREFVIDLYNQFDMDYFNFVSENLNLAPVDKPIRADVTWEYSYDDLLKDTVADLEKFL